MKLAGVVGAFKLGSGEPTIALVKTQAALPQSRLRKIATQDRDVAAANLALTR